ncbi:hypothetical protein G9A89_016803 [Geosiphon pyriformis]|nr:hypothetical protein G9A89_016803 [Geosiphon pyriformis]
MKELSLVVNNLPNNKAARLLGLPNKLWKHCNGEVLAFSIIPKPYEWNGVLTNTKPITLVKTACKILSKILSYQISLACSKFNVLHVLQDMYKAYNSVGWHHLRASLHHIKMCKCFIQFFGNIYEDRINRVITDFGLLDGNRVHDKLNQEEVFSLLLWRIFYDPLLCEVKRHEHLCGYRIDSKFVAKSGRIEVSGGKTSFLAAGIFASTQYILNIASEFFVINDILINNNKMITISINQRVRNALLLINRLPILIAKKSESHQYLGIFLSTEGFSKPSLA